MANLISVDDYKVLKGINSTTNDERFDVILTSVSKLVRTYCNQAFDTYSGSPGKTEYFDIQWETHVVQLHESPVIDVLNVYERYAQSEDYTELYRDGENDCYDWYFDVVTDAIIRTTELGGYKSFPRGVGSVKVVYTAGYLEIPDDIKLAIADLVTYYYKDEYKLQQTIGATTQQGAPVTAVKNDPGFPDHIRRVLDLYRNV